MNQATTRVLEGVLRNLATKINAPASAEEKDALEGACALINRLVLDCTVGK